MVGAASVCDAGLTIALKVTPRARRNAVGAFVADADGERLAVSVTEAPEKGAANAAVIKLLARAWRFRKSDMSIIRGETDRRKTLLIKGDGKDHLRAVELWIANQQGATI